MKSRPKTIKIFLPEGSATSIKEAELTNRLILAISSPRSKLEALRNSDASKYTSIYFLFGETEEELEPMVYMGQGEEVLLV